MIDWRDENGEIEEQLKLQVEMQFKNHHSFLINHGLQDCKTVLEIGVGDGTFLRELATAHHDISFTGIDNNPSMVDNASSKCTINMKCAIGDARRPKSIENITAFDAIIMRYILLHADDKSDIINTLSQAMKPGAKLWIIDLDLESFTSVPPSLEFDWIVDQVRAYCESHGPRSNIGSACVQMLASAGFTSINKVIEPLNNRETKLDTLSKFIISEVKFYRSALSKNTNLEDITRINDFLAKLNRDDIFIRYGVSMISAVK
ncbi:class I SAM-dependent methyltransferase [Thiorhodococcus fuscus]|uniref:Class I SAM-dependent methyltransferase n=1 Tax=Thiorhodococcus fuscus TaxID=527200 RepID=A0ABW4YB89_9GAMM